MKVWKRRMRMSMERRYVGLVESTMQLMSSGFAVTFVRNGSMESVLRSPQQGPSTLNSTNAHLVATREHVLDDDRCVRLGSSRCILALNGSSGLVGLFLVRRLSRLPPRCYLLVANLLFI